MHVQKFKKAEKLKKSRFRVELPINAGGENLLALYQTMTESFVLVPGELWSQILSSPEDVADPETLEYLHDEGFLVKEDVDETALFECWKQQHVHDFSRITSKVLVTRKCNNDCLYCILDHEAADMSPGTALQTDSFYIETIREKRPEQVKDDYLGGEPLLNSKIILESAGRRFRFCREQGIKYSFSFTTNGTLLNPKIVSEMKKVGLEHVRVSMAGPARIHDILRPLKNKGKTYDLILKNLKSISGMIPVLIACQYDSGTEDYKKMAEMFNDFKTRGIKIKEVSFSPILAKRGKDEFDSGLGDAKIALSLMHLAQKHGYGYSGEPRAPSNLCKTDFRAMFVFDTDGSIIPCPSLQEGEMAYGNVAKGVDFVEESQLLKRNLPDKCQNQCALLPICMGGCRLQALTKESNFSGIDCLYDAHQLFCESYMKEMAMQALAQEEEKDEAEETYQKKTA